jgi:dephospho-CoA kinase
MIVLGLTGSIGMGKSTTAQMFRDLGIPVHDADATVHALYRGELAGPIGEAFPGTVADGKVDRAALGRAVLGDNAAMRRLEAIVHPAVRRAEQEFLRNCQEKGADIALIDVPLLFETGGQDRVDAIVVVTASQEEQRRRVLERPGMTPEKFEQILARQTPDAEKRRRADFLVVTDNGLEDARRQVAQIVAALRSGDWKSGGKAPAGA